MNDKDLEFELALADSERMLKNAARDAEDGGEYTLESILAEFGAEGGGKNDPAPDALEPLKPAVTLRVPPEPAPEDPPAPEPKTGPEAEPKPEAEPESEPEEEPFVEAPDDPPELSLEEVVSQTVKTVLDEKEPLLEEKPRRGLFSRRRERDTEELYDRAAHKEANRDADEYEEPEPPEPPVEETVRSYRDSAVSSRRSLRAAFAVTVLMWLPPLVQYLGYMPEAYAAEPLLSCLPFFVAEALVCLLGRDVFVYAWEQLLERKITYELLTALLALASLTDTALAFFLPERAAAVPIPFHSIGALAVTAALFGRTQLFRAMYDTFRVAAVGEPPYMVTVTAGGAAKRNGALTGFSNRVHRDDAASRTQTLLLPLILTAALVFSVLSTVRVHSWAMLAWNLSALLAGANALSFPLVYPLPLRRITSRLAKCGGALGGWVGADAIRRSNCVILSDSDLFPPGTLTLNGLKIFSEESGKVISYAATMAHASESGLARLFDVLLQNEGGTLQPLSDLNFYEQGGVVGTIRGETVLFGTASFCRKMGITLPSGLTLKTGVFLAVDGALIAVFAVKYMAAENVDWALHALHRSHITPVLAVRDGNITPALLKRKFGTDARAVYPKLSTRLALSGHGPGKPLALLYREGLMPYAEIAVGSKRLCRAVRVGTVLSMLSSVVGTLLAFYLTNVAAYNALTPYSMLAFSLLWALAALIDAVFVDRY